VANIGDVSKNTELTRRILFTLAMLAIYRVGVHVPTPGVDGAAVFSFFQAQSSGIFGLFNTFTGGALSQFSIFALGIMPYISASIIFQLLTSAIPYLEALKKEGEPGRRKINQYTRNGRIVSDSRLCNQFLANGFNKPRWSSISDVSYRWLFAISNYDNHYSYCGFLFCHVAW